MTWLLLGFFGLVMTSVAAAGYWLLRARAAGPAAGLDIAGPGQEALSDSIATGLTALGQRLGSNAKRDEELRKQLFRAGYRSPGAYLTFHGIQVTAAIACFLIVGGAALSLGAGAFLPAICAAGFGFLIPARILEYQVRRRGWRIRSGVAPCLDLLVLAIEAGQGLDQAMRDTAASLRGVHPDLCGELVFCHLEMHAGASRVDALRRLGERGGDEELRKLAHLLIDGERFGTSLGPALRTHSRFLRTRLRQSAQESARRLGVKLVFPVFFLIFPSVLLVTLGPAYLQMRDFLDQFLK